MTALAKEVEYFSPEEYLDRELFSEVRHEYFNGRVYEMAESSADHHRIVVNLVAEVGNALKGRQCEGFAQHRQGAGWKPESIMDRNAIVRLDSIDVQIPFAVIYERTAVLTKPS